MNQLVSVRTNIFYTKVGEEYKRVQELIFLVDNATYSYSNEGKVVRERGLSEMRITVTENAFEQMLEILGNLKNAKEEDLD